MITKYFQNFHYTQAPKFNTVSPTATASHFLQKNLQGTVFIFSNEAQRFEVLSKPKADQEKKTRKRNAFAEISDHDGKKNRAM